MILPSICFVTYPAFALSFPKTILGPAIIDSVKQYIDGGGNAMFYTEPGKQSILNPALNHIGVNSDEGTIVRVSRQDLPHKFDRVITEKGTDMADELFLYMHKQGLLDTCKTNIVGASNLSYHDTAGFKATPITTLYNNQSTWVEKGILVVDSAAPDFNSREGDYRLNTPYTVGLQLTRNIKGREQRIIINSDADMMSGARGNGGHYGNAFYSYAVYNELPVYHNVKSPTDTWLTIKKTPAKTLKVVLQYGVPCMLLFVGIVILIRRKRKQQVSAYFRDLKW